MVDFSTLLKKPAGEAKKPAALPAGSYHGIVKSHEVGDNNKNKTPYVRFHLGLTGLPDGMDASELDGADLSKRQLRRDFFLTDDALWRLDEFLKSCGVNPQGRAYEEVLTEVIGANVLVEVQQYVNQSSSEVGNQVGKVIGAN
jgi:hypothetical protein